MLEEMIAYMELHLISLEQDAENIQKALDEFYEFESNEYHALEAEDANNTGEMWATQHLLSVARDILSKTKEN